MSLLILLLTFFCAQSDAAKLQDVNIIDIKSVNSGLELKLQTEENKGSHFFILIEKKDPKSFQKLVTVIEKLKLNQKKMELNIPSFSVAPSGSYYLSKFVSFKITN
jgi:hypothetical protein